MKAVGGSEVLLRGFLGAGPGMVSRRGVGSWCDQPSPAYGVNALGHFIYSSKICPGSDAQHELLTAIGRPQ